MRILPTHGAPSMSSLQATESVGLILSSSTRILKFLFASLMMYPERSFSFDSTRKLPPPRGRPESCSESPQSSWKAIPK